MKNKSLKDQYFLLTEILDSVKWQLEGGCEDIDCDRYIYKNCLKKSIKPVLEHNLSCMPKLKTDYNALVALLSDKKFKKLRYEKCQICKKEMDKLDNKNPLTSFMAIKPKSVGRLKGYEMRIKRTHKKCQKKLKTPEGFRRR